MANPDLIHHDETQFAKSIVELCPGVWSAVGYAASTQHMIEGETSVTIIDTSAGPRRQRQRQRKLHFHPPG